MKRLISLVLVLAVVMSLGVSSLMLVEGATEGNSGDVHFLAVADAASSTIPGDVMWVTDSQYEWVLRIGSFNLPDGSKLGTPVPNTDYTSFKGRDINESISYAVRHVKQDGTAGSMPQGVNGEDLLSIRKAFDTDLGIYRIYVSPQNNATVEYFHDVTITYKIVIVAKITSDSKTTTTFEGTGIVFDKSFDLANKRYTTKDVWKDANGVWRISASDARPVVEAGCFAKAWGKKLVVDYPNYRVIFPTVKNQDVALNLQAKVSGNSTVKLADNQAILTATFHDIYVKDTTQIEFKVNADSQNYKGTTLYAYELDSNGNVIKSKEHKVIVTESKTIVVEIPANTRLASTGDVVNAATYGIFGTPQEGTVDPGTGTGTGTGTTNPGTGPSDTISIATAFAVISLAAAGFVAVGKAGKK